MDSLFNEDTNYILNLYKRINIHVKKADGCFLIDDKNNKYLDMYSGLSVNNFGHNNEDIVNIIYNQSKKYIHLSNNFISEPVLNLAKLLVQNSFESKVFFANSGTEANEAAIKLVKKYGKNINDSKNKILAFTNSFHGRTCGSLSITNQIDYQEPFFPLLPNTQCIKFNDIEDLKSKADENTCAVFIEVIQGSGGVREVSQEFIQSLTQLSKDYNFLIVVDEIQTGLGRTGDLFSYKKFNFTPHIVTLAKSLGGGIPIGAMIVRDDIKDVLTYGDHGSTFGGNPIACAVGSYIVDKVTHEVFKNEILHKSNYLFDKLYELKKRYPQIIKEIRGRGLMIGIEVGKNSNIIKEEAFKNNLLVNVTNKSVIRLLPPLSISIEEIDIFLNIFDDILKNI